MGVSRFFSWSVVVGIVLTLGLFVIEIFTHVLGNVAYVAIAGYALWITKDHAQITVITIVATILLIMGYGIVVSLPQSEDHLTFFVNRISALIVLWFEYFFILRYRSTQAKELSQRKELEQRQLEEERLKSSLEIYQAIARNFPIGWIGILDETFTYIVADGQGFGATGIKAGDLIGKKFSDILENSKNEMYLKEVLQGKTVEFEISHKDRIFEINASPLHGRVQSKWMLVVVHDITTVKETETGLIKALEKEQELGELKSRFITMASHEFRTPLTTIMTSASLLSGYDRDKYENEKNAHLARIKRSVNLLTDILKNFLSLGKVDVEEMQPHYETFHFREFLDELIEENESLRPSNQKLTIKHSGAAKIVSDKNYLKTILHNLLSNAFQYSLQGGQVLLETRYQSGLLNVRVTDYGIGIPQADQKYIFEHFFRGQNAVNIKGTGLGLCIVQQYVKILKGSIDFQSVPGEGTIFTLSLGGVE